MGSQHGKLYISQQEYDRLVACCADGYVCKEKEGYEYDEEYRFPDGVRMAFQVCRSRGESCWTQGVLFDKDGNELGCTDCSDGIETEFDIEHDGTNYCVEVCVNSRIEPEDLRKLALDYQNKDYSVVSPERIIAALNNAADTIERQRRPLLSFLETIEATGGVNADLSPVADWQDLGEAYAEACSALGHEMKQVKPDED
jgi:hypothetical protein